MRINSRVYDEKQDMFEAIRVPTCPSEFRAVAENILAMATKPGYAVSDYNTMTELDKILMWDYWREFDGMKIILQSMTPKLVSEMQEWFIKKATPPELIRRARQYLVEKNWIIVKPEVRQRASDAGAKFRKSVKAGG